MAKKKADKKSEKPKKFTKKQENERREAWIRIPVCIVSGFILDIWGFFVFIFAIVQFIMVLVEGKKNKEFLNFCKTYVAQLYVFVKYITFISNERPFPFADLKKFEK
jgi:uncharacterized protein YqhQ